MPLCAICAIFRILKERAGAQRRRLQARIGERPSLQTRRPNQLLHQSHAKEVAAYETAKLASDFDPQNRDENVDYYVAKLDELVKKFGANIPALAQAQLL